MNEPKVGEICWTELATTNVEAAKDFYSKVFGWTFTEIDAGECKYTMVKTDAKDFGGIWEISKEQKQFIPPSWMAYILVTSVDESLASASKHGAKVVKEATDVGDLGRFAVVQDPTGAHISMWQNFKCL